MQARTAPTLPPREPRPPREIDDDQSPIEEWALDEVAGDFEFGAVDGLRGSDGAFD